MKNNKTKGIIIAILILLIVLAVAGIWAFSKYTTSVTGSGTATVANWSFKANNSTTTIANVALTDTTLNGNVTDGKIAPGTDGTFAITVDGSGSDVAIDYTIQISNITNMPANVHFYSDSAFANELTETSVGSGIYQVTGTIELADIETPVSADLYWKWDYETGTGAENIANNDTVDVSAAGSTPTFTVSVSGTQVNPGN